MEKQDQAAQSAAWISRVQVSYGTDCIVSNRPRLPTVPHETPVCSRIVNCVAPWRAWLQFSAVGFDCELLMPAGVLCNCIAHALTTEKEEIMGLLLGDTVQTEAGETITHIWRAVPQVRNDRRKVRNHAPASNLRTENVFCHSSVSTIPFTCADTSRNEDMFEQGVPIELYGELQPHKAAKK